MSLADYIDAPFKSSKNQNSIYNKSFLKMSPAPEYANGEVMLAALYRKVGFASTETSNGVSERDVPGFGRSFQRQLFKEVRENKSKSPSGMPENVWRRLIESTLRSPLQPNQSASKYIQLSPIVPDACIYSLTPRQTKNSWDAGTLIQRILQFSGLEPAELKQLWARMFRALSVTSNDDIWAQFIQAEFESWRPQDLANGWAASDMIDISSEILSWNTSNIQTPASRFTKDLLSIIDLKSHLTRRQWITMIESIIRIGAASHILWLCKVNDQTFRLLQNALNGNKQVSTDDVSKSFGMDESFWRYGAKAAAPIKKAATDYLKARVGINIILHQLEDQVGSSAIQGGLNNVQDITTLLNWVSTDKVRSHWDFQQFKASYQEVLEKNPSLMLGKKGISSNIIEFLRHVLGQRSTNESGLDTYDQGYFLAKRGSYKTAPWAISLGPVSVMALVHACTYDSQGARTVDNFCAHLKEYGVEIDPDDISNSELGNTMRSLGLVLDSPDAEGGIALINPFDYVFEER